MRKDIDFVRGETVSITLSLTDPNTGDAFEVLSTDVIKFAMETAENETVIKTSVTGSTTIVLDPTQTIELPAGRYFYDIGLLRGSDYYVIIQKSVLSVIDNVTVYNS